MLNNIFQIALNTYRESVRGKVLYSLLFFSVALVIISAVFGAVTIGDQIIIIKDFGLVSLSLFAVTLAVISGASLLHKELYRKTVYNILAKPVPRWQFLVGKHLGLLFTVLLMIILMAIGLVLFIFFFEQKIDWLIFQAALFVIFELIIITAFAIFFSAIVVTPALAGLFTFSAFLAGRSVEFIPELIKIAGNGETSPILEIIYWVLPHLDKLNINNQIVYGQGATFEQLIFSFCYSIGYSATLIMIGSFFFRNRDFN